MHTLILKTLSVKISNILQSILSFPWRFLTALLVMARSETASTTSSVSFNFPHLKC